MDKRLALPADTELRFDGLACVVGEEIGRGSNAIVYRGWYKDAVSVAQKHHVLIKELFPYDEKAAVYRDGQDVRWLPEAQAVAALHRRSFLWGNGTHLELRERYPYRTGGNINTYSLNNTFYTVLDFSGGRTLEQELLQQREEGSLRRTALRMIGVLEALEIFHEFGYLHLDISPDNILLLDEGQRERVELIDYNSVVRLADIAQGGHIYVSMKAGYASPEMRRHAYGEVGPWTDLYAVAAVFFRCLTGDILSRMQAGDMLPADISGSPLLRGVPETVKSMASQIIVKGLRAVKHARYQSTAEMLADFQELVDRIDGVGVTHSALWEAGSRSIRRIVEANPSLAYVRSEDQLFPVEATRPDGSKTRDILHSGRNAVLTGSGGMGKTTLLLRHAWRERKGFGACKSAVLYISLYGYREGDAHYIHDSILRKLRFKPETGTYEDARHALDLLIQKPLDAPDGKAPTLCLLLDGYNEISGSASALIQEIEDLAGMEGVSVLVASRNDIPELSFEKWRLNPLPEPVIRQVLNSRGILLPEPPQIRELLSNAMMLRLFTDACQGAEEQIAVQTGSELIETYLRVLLQKETQKLPESSPEKWQLSAAVHYVYPMIARREARKKRSLTNIELLGLMGTLYKQLGTRTFSALFPEWVGHSPEIRGDAKNAEAWYRIVIHDILWRRLGLLYQDEHGEYRVVHQEFLKTMEAEAAKIQKPLRRKRVHGTVTSLMCVALIALIGLGLSRQLKPYDVMQTQDMLGYAQQVCTEMNRQYVTMEALVHQESRDFDGAKAVLGKSNFRVMMGGGEDVTAELEKRCEALESTGKRVPWGTLAFDGARFIEMARLLAQRADRYAAYVDELQTVFGKGTQEDYQKRCALVADVLEADADASAAYEHVVYAMRADGMATWEGTAEGRAYAGSFNRLDKGRGYYAAICAHADERWQSATAEQMTTALNGALKASLTARSALAEDTTFARLQRAK